MTCKSTLSYSQIFQGETKGKHFTFVEKTEIAFSILFALFIGSYADKIGRRPLLMIPLVGFILSTLVYLVNINCKVCIGKFYVYVFEML